MATILRMIIILISRIRNVKLGICPAIIFIIYIYIFQPSVLYSTADICYNSMSANLLIYSKYSPRNSILKILLTLLITTAAFDLCLFQTVDVSTQNNFFLMTETPCR